MPIIKIWLDDVRPVPDDSWYHITTGEDCVHFIKWAGLENIAAISFDNDLGEGVMEGYQVLNTVEHLVAVRAISSSPLNSVPTLSVHSANPVARARMEMIIERIRKMIEENS